MPTIKIKRGIKNSMPTLGQGELAFTTDTKEVYIGDGKNNYNITRATTTTDNKNLISNGNFQYAVDKDDITGFNLTPNNGKYCFGNFYITNLSNSTGNISINMPTTGNGKLKINCNNAYFAIEYRIKLPKYITGSNTTYSSALENHQLSISFDVTNNTNGIISYKSGQENYTQNGTCPSGNSKQTIPFTYTKSIIYENNYPSMNFLLIKTISPITGLIEIGNFKVEDSNIATIFSPNLIYDDVLTIRESYEEINAYLNSTFVTGNNVEFYLPITVSDAYNYNCKFTINKIVIYNLDGVIQNGFTNTSSYEETNKVFKISVTKANHRLTTAIAFIQIKKDFRP